MVLHKHGEYLYNQVQMILQKRSEDLLERLGWRGPPLPSPNSLNSSSARLKHRHALQGGAEYGRDVPPRAQEAVGGLQARPRGANPPRFLQRRERSSQPSGMLRCLLVLLSSIRLAGFGFALPALPAAERENRGRRVWRCLPSCAEPMAAPARCSPRSSFQKRRATIVSGGIPQCILGDARFRRRWCATSSCTWTGPSSSRTTSAPLLPRARAPVHRHRLRASPRAKSAARPPSHGGGTCGGEARTGKFESALDCGRGRRGCAVGMSGCGLWGVRGTGGWRDGPAGGAAGGRCTTSGWRPLASTACAPRGAGQRGGGVGRDRFRAEGCGRAVDGAACGGPPCAARDLG